MTHSSNQLDPEFWRALAPMRSIQEYAVGATLFERGQPAQGIYFIEQGKVKMLLDRNTAKLFEVAGPGSVLGLTESVAGQDYKATAEAVDPIRVGFVERSELLAFLLGHCELCMQIVQLLSEDLHALYHEFRSTERPEPRRRKRPVSKPN